LGFYDKEMPFILSFKKLPKILSQMYFPQCFADYILNVFEWTQSYEEKIIALDCMIVLVSKQSFEIDHFY